MINLKRIQLKTSTLETINGYLYILPWMLGFLIFTLGPFIASFLLSFSNYAIATPPRWAGLSNYRRAFLQDDLFWTSLRRTGPDPVRPPRSS